VCWVLAKRDLVLPERQKRLRKHAESTYADGEATVTALFAAPEAVQAPRKRRAKREKKQAEDKQVANGAAASA